ncbi:hypothetical protein PV04_06209 [Phialophora macrospora]|uniref:Extracellular membrane protein CFEM domain-containing protein n=1 Tax=Phialophora macrospora TaxID=1851006 RepID=A0A0D2DXT2_9EURO|nr:hypothetical protein PV04_06209 [Phialophora macrospora]
MLPVVTSLPFLLFLSSLIPSIRAQGFNNNNPQRPSSTSTTSTSARTSTSTSTTPTSTSIYGTCVDACITADPIVNHCDGTETGSALDQCKCRSYTPSNDPLINCILSCPTDQQYNFADTLPKLCAQTLFLGLNLTETPKPYAENTVASATFGAAQAQNTGTGANSGNAAVTLHGVNVLGLLGATLGIAVFL